MRHLIASLLVALPVLAAAAPPRNFDARVEAVMKASEVPGATIAIVENGKVTHARGYGVKSLGTADAVDADTLFQIGSTTKAFTSAALAILVEDGKIGWDDRVIDHLPGFRMYDPWVTREITIRDLLVHRSGLGPGPGRPDVRAVHRDQPSGPGAADPVPQAEDQFSLCAMPTTTCSTPSPASWSRKFPARPGRTSSRRASSRRSA